jgi:UBX domain-containing protein 11
MESFLSDYGLKWVGSKPEGKLDVASLMQDIPSTEALYRYNLPNEIDIAVLERRVQELNIIAEKDAARWVSEGAVHRFKAPDNVCITFFKNGLVLQGFPFRPYSSKEAQSLLSDILDGYFPYDLKKKYPDGVPLRTADRTADMFKAEGKILGVNDPSLGLLNKEQFLAQLPENVIRGGEIIPVREDIAKVFGSEKTGTVKVETHVDVILRNNAEFREFTTLRIKTETGKRNLIILMLFSDTLGKLKKFLDQNRENKGRVELRSTFPARIFDFADERSLEELELVPNYALALRNIE